MTRFVCAQGTHPDDKSQFCFFDIASDKNVTAVMSKTVIPLLFKKNC